MGRPLDAALVAERDTARMLDEAGMEEKDIASAMGRKVTWVYDALEKAKGKVARDAGVTRQRRKRRPNFNAEEKQAICDTFLQGGVDIPRLAHAHNTVNSAIWRVLKKKNIFVGRGKRGHVKNS